MILTIPYRLPGGVPSSGGLGNSTAPSSREGASESLPRRSQCGPRQDSRDGFRGVRADHPPGGRGDQEGVAVWSAARVPAMIPESGLWGGPTSVTGAVQFYQVRRALEGTTTRLSTSSPRYSRPR